MTGAPGSAQGRRGPGRPSVAAVRRDRIVDAFITLVAERGAEATSTGDVAAVVGVPRTAVRHFVGNRKELVEAAVQEIVARYRAELRAAAGPEPTPDTLVNLLFGASWVEERSTEARAFDALLYECARDPSIQPLVRSAYEALTGEIVAALRRAQADSQDADLEDTAYVVVCLAEQNALLQQLGFPAGRSQAAAALARAVLGRLVTG